MVECYLLMDIGSTSIKCSIIKKSRSKIDALDNLPVLAQQSQFVEVDAEGCYDTDQLIESATNVASNALNEAYKIVSTRKSCTDSIPITLSVDKVMLTTFVSNLVAVDEHNRPVTKLYTYRFNGDDANLICSSLKQNLKEQKTSIYNATGAPLHASYATCAMAYLLSTANRTQLNSNNIHWTTLGSLLLSYWTGTNASDIGISLSEASWWGMLEWRSGKWHIPLLNAVGVDTAQLPCVHSNPVIENSLIDTKIKLGIHDFITVNTKFYRAIGDGYAATMGTAAQITNRHTMPIACTIGTSAALRCIIPLDALESMTEEHTNFLVDSGLFAYRVDANNILLGGALTDAGSLTISSTNILHDVHNKEIQGNTCLTTKGQISDNLQEIQADTNYFPTGLTTMPFWSGERATGWNSNARGAIIGLSHTTTQSDILKSKIEGVCFRLEAILNGILPLLNKSSCVIMNGGAIVHSPLWEKSLACLLLTNPNTYSIQLYKLKENQRNMTELNNALKISDLTSIGLLAHQIDERLISTNSVKTCSDIPHQTSNSKSLSKCVSSECVSSECVSSECVSCEWCKAWSQARHNHTTIYQMFSRNIWCDLK